MWAFFVPQFIEVKSKKKDRERKKLTFVEQEVKPIKNASYAVKKVLNNDDWETDDHKFPNLYLCRERRFKTSCEPKSSLYLRI